MRRKFGLLWRFLLFSSDYVYKAVALRTGPRVFVALFNFRARFQKKDVRFLYGSRGEPFLASSSRHWRYFYEREQSWNYYSDGLSERARNLAEDYLLSQVGFSGGDLVVDVGANVGDLKLYFEELGLRIRYMPIEPSPEEFSCLERNCGPGINAGLWFEDGELDFYVSSRNGDSSFIRPNRYSEIIRVLSCRLDNLVSEPIKLLKLEAEGAELEALLGCEKLLPTISWISADLGFERQGTSPLPQVTNYLLRNRFELVDVGSRRLVALFRRVG